MPSISHNLKTAFRVGYMCVILLIPKATSEFGSSNDDNPINHLADSPAVGEVVGKIASPIEDLSMGSQKNPLIDNVNNFEKHPNDPFVQEVTRVGSNEDDMIELSSLSRKKKFLWFQYGKDESGETRFRTLHGKNYNPYDFDEYDYLNANQYEDKLMSKTGAKVEKAKAGPETKSEASSPKVEESLKQQPDSDRKENLQKSSSTADQQMPNKLPINGDKPAKMEGAADETLMKEFAENTNQVVSDTQNSQMTKSQSSQSSTMPKSQMQIKEEDPRGSSEKVKEKHRGRKQEDSLMLEFAHNRPDSRILWLNHPVYQSVDEYRLIDEAAERTLITYREFGFVNTDIDSMKAVEEFITYVENNKIGNEVLNIRITQEWNQKSPEMRAAVCKYLVNDNMMLRKYQFVYDSSQSPEQIQAHDVTILLQIEDLQPRRLGALSCPAIQPNTSLAVTLFMSPITYVDDDTDEYVFTFVEEDPFNRPLYVRLMFLSRLASGDSVESEFVDDQKIIELDEPWWYGRSNGAGPEPAPKNDEPTSKK